MTLLQRKSALVLGTSVLSVALMSGVAAAAFPPVDTETSAHPERVEKAKPPLPNLEEILDKLVAAGRLTATQRESILAAVKEHSDAAEAKRPAFNWKGHLEAYLRTSATFLGMTEKELQSALREGKSLAQIAVAKAKTREGLIVAITAAANAKVDEALAANKMTAEQAAKARAEIAGRAAKLVDAKHEPKADDKDEKKKHESKKDEQKTKEKDERKSEQKMRIDVHKLLGDSLRSAVAYLGLESKAVHEQLRSGKSLAELATGPKNRAGLIEAISTPANKKLDEMAASGRLTEEQATRTKAQVAEAAAKIVDSKAMRKVTPPGQGKRP